MNRGARGKIVDSMFPCEKGVVPLPSPEYLAQMLYRCRQERDQAQARCLLVCMRKNGLEAHQLLGNGLVVMLVEVGNVRDAQHVFHSLVSQEEYSWSSSIIGYIQCGKPQHAFSLYQMIQGVSSVHLNKNALKALLKTCTQLKELERGVELHAEMSRMGLLDSDIFVGNMLVDMYAKCGLLAKAHEVFDRLPVRDVVSWNGLISGFVENGLSEEALDYRDQMQMENVSPDVITFVSCLKACGSIKAMDKGCEIHAEIERKGLSNKNPLVGTALVAMYVKCGLPEIAQETFDKLPVRDAVLWTALITGYAGLGHGEKALSCFENMQLEGVSPDDITYVCSLKACGSIGAISKGLQIHMDIEKKGFLEKNLDIGNTLVDMYCKCGLLVTAQQVFDKLPALNAVSWNALITGYTEHGSGEEAFKCFKKMLLAGVCPSAVTFISSLKACGSIKAAEKGEEIHAQVVRKGLLEKDIVVGTALLDMYGKCGIPAKAQQVFDELPAWNVFSWNALIAGYAEHGHDEKALNCLSEMQLHAVAPDVVTLVWSLKACGCLGAVDKGQEIHAEIKQKGNLERDLVIGTALVDMYAKCGCMAKAQQLFDKLPVRNVVGWTALIAGYADHGHGQEALKCLYQMQLEGVTPNAVTLLCSLKACVSIGGAAGKAKEVVDEIATRGLLENDLYVGNALVDTYSKCGSPAKAQEVFDQLPIRDAISWNALIAGSIEQGHGEDVLKCFERMQLEGVSPDAVTYICSLKACGKIGATDTGQELHVEIERKGLLHSNVIVGSTLVDMYAKCGLLTKAQEVLDKLPVRNVVSWNALIAGFSQLGESQNVFLCFNKMVGEGMKPDRVTFVIVLSACNHTGMFDKSLMYFEVMSKEYGIVPILEHHSCMVDLLGRSGEVDKAEGMIKNMPIYPNVVVWHTLLGACRKWGNVSLGKHAFEHAVCLDEKDGAAYVLMSNIYAGANK